MAAFFTDFPSLPQFDATGDACSLSQKWLKWKDRFELYIEAVGVEKDERKWAIFLHLAGPKVQEIFKTLSDTGTDLETAIEKLDEYFLPKRNIAFERHVFRQAKQEDSERLDNYVTRLRQLAETCDYEDNTDDMIRDQIVDKCKSTRLRRRFLREGDLNVDKCLELGRLMETVESQASEMENGQSQNVSQVSTHFQRGRGRYRSNIVINCYRCGVHGHIAKNCHVARDIDCRKCGKLGHLARACRSKDTAPDATRHNRGRSTARGSASYRSRDAAPSRTSANWRSGRNVNFVSGKDTLYRTSQDNLEDTEDEFIFSMTDSKCGEKVPVMVGNLKTEMCVDSGAGVNIANSELCKKMRRRGCVLEATKKKLFAYGSKTPLNVQGKFKTTVTCGTQTVEAVFIYVPGDGHSLLGRNTASELGVLKIGINVIGSDSEQLEEEFKDCFEGVGKLKDFQLKLHIDSSVRPVAQPTRRVPFHMRKQVEQKIKELLDLDVIEEVKGPSPWVSPLVVVPKSSTDIRICVDMRLANRAVIRERHPIPTMEEILHDMNGSTVFSKLDIRMAYHQIELDSTSRQITTFTSHVGLFQYKRLMFGINAAPEMYQHIISQTLQGCEGVKNLSDDIIVHGKNKEEHDARLRSVLQRLRESGLTLNKSKCKFNMKKLVFFGHVFTDKGVKPEESKVQAIINARRPDSPSEVRSFLGLVNFSARYIPDMATIAEPLRRLTHSKQTWKWEEEQENAFNALKRRLASTEVMAYFSTEAETRIIVDASPVGLGAILTQQQQDGSYQPVIYASRTLTDTEKRYSQTEKEALAVVWGCERFQIYLLGSRFELITDHKPLEVIYSTKSKPCARIERWVLRLQPFEFTVKYKPGPTNAADALSRLTQTDSPNEENEGDDYIRYVMQHSIPKAFYMEEIQKATEEDEELCGVMRHLQNSHEDKYKGVYKKDITEMSVCDDIVLKGTRIVMPESLRNRTLKLAHETHQGIVRTKQLMREKVWWPSLNKDIEKLISTCHVCQVLSDHDMRPEPMRPTELPSRPWEHISIDLCGPFPTGENLLVVVDYYSRWPEVGLLKSTNTQSVIKALDKIFARHGLPDKLTSDNGPQFRSEEFREFLQRNAIQHRKTTPYWPQANGEVERMNRSILKAIRAANLEKKNWRSELQNFLLAYRTTPHATTGKSPAELLMNRKLRTKLPVVLETVKNSDVKLKDSSMKTKGKEYADTVRKAEKSTISVGDKIILRQKHENKLSPKFNPIPYTVVEKKGNAVTLRSMDNQNILRNSSQMKKYSCASSDNDNVPQTLDLSDPGETTLAETSPSEVNTEGDDSNDIDPRRSERIRTKPCKLADYELYLLMDT